VTRAQTLDLGTTWACQIPPALLPAACAAAYAAGCGAAECGCKPWPHNAFRITLKTSSAAVLLPASATPRVMRAAALCSAAGLVPGSVEQTDAAPSTPQKDEFRPLAWLIQSALRVTVYNILQLCAPSRAVAAPRRSHSRTTSHRGAASSCGRRRPGVCDRCRTLIAATMPITIMYTTPHPAGASHTAGASLRAQAWRAQASADTRKGSVGLQSRGISNRNSAAEGRGGAWRSTVRSGRVRARQLPRR
jgi:hypothetical protein